MRYGTEAGHVELGKGPGGVTAMRFHMRDERKDGRTAWRSEGWQGLRVGTLVVLSILAWRIPGMGEPGGLLSMGSHRVAKIPVAPRDEH